MSRHILCCAYIYISDLIIMTSFWRVCNVSVKHIFVMFDTLFVSDDLYYNAKNCTLRVNVIAIIVTSLLTSVTPLFIRPHINALKSPQFCSMLSCHGFYQFGISYPTVAYCQIACLDLKQQLW